jgi:membrane protease YdiL (CAAX protease family)
VASPRPDPLASYEDRAASLVFSVLLVCAGFGVGVLFARLFPGPSVGAAGGVGLTAENLRTVVVRLGAAEVGFPLVAVGFLYWRGNSVRDLGIWRPNGRDILTAVGGTAGLLAVNVALFAATGALGGPSPLADSVAPTTVLVLLGAVMVLVVAPAEEFLFRGVIQRYLAGPFGKWGAVGVAGVLFAAAHVANAGAAASPRVILLADLIAGLFLGWTYEYTDNLLVPTVIHGAYNTVLVSLTFL